MLDCPRTQSGRLGPSAYLPLPAQTTQCPTVPDALVPNLYGTIRGLLIGDKGFISGDLKLEAAAHEIDLQTPLRKNMPDGRDPDAVARLVRIRRAVETAIGKLSEVFAAQTTKARDLPSFVSRMARKLLAYNFSLMAAQA